MSILNSVGDFFALDVSANGIRAVHLKGTGHKSLHRYASAPVDKRVAVSDAPADKQKLMGMVKNLLQQSGITAKNVVLSIPSNKSFITVVDLPKLEGKDMNKSVQYQADQFIPMSADEAKIDWAVLGDSPADANKAEVLIASVANEYAESRLDLMESIGLNVIAMEPEQVALARSLLPADFMGAVLILEMGELSTNLIAVYGGSPRLMRSIPIGGETMVKAAIQNLGVEPAQAVQFVYKFGLMQSKLEGQVFKAIQGVADNLLEEIDKSMKFFTTRYQGAQFAKIIITGQLAILPDFPVYLVNHTQIPVEIGNSWTNISYPNSMTNDLASVSYQYSVVVGLAQRQE